MGMVFWGGSMEWACSAGNAIVYRTRPPRSSLYLRVEWP
jgi:hypothetical protein